MKLGLSYRLLVLVFVFQISSANGLHTDRLLQQMPPAGDNPNNPTGPDMHVLVDEPSVVQTLTPKIVNEIAQKLNQDTSGNAVMADTGASLMNNLRNSKSSIDSNEKFGAVSNGNALSSPLGSTVRVQTSTPTVGTTQIAPVLYQAQENNISALVLDDTTNLVFKYQNIDDLINQSKDFAKGLQQLTIQNIGYLTANQLISVQSNSTSSTGEIMNTYRMLYRITNGTIINTTFVTNPGNFQVGLLGFNEFMAPPKSPLILANPEVQMTDGILRKAYNEYIDSASLIVYNEIKFNPSISIYFFQYSSNANLYEAIIRNNNNMIAILNFVRISGYSIGAPSFSLVPSIFYANWSEYLVMVRKIEQQIAKRGNPQNTNLIKSSVMPITVGKLILCNDYDLDNYNATICGSISLSTRIPQIEYYRQRSDNKTSASEYTEQQYTQMLKDPGFRVTDETARRQYKSQITNAPISKIQTKLTRIGKAYRVTYLGHRQNIQVGFTPS